MQIAKSKSALDPFSLKGVLILSCLYGLVHALIRLTAGTNLALDDTKENLFTQSLEWGYLPDNPPLYEWALNFVQLFTGPTLFSFLILKYALLVCTAGFLFLTARRIFQDDKWAALTVFSATLLYQLGYNYHQAFSHTLMVIAAVAFALWAFVRLAQEQRLQDYLLFGVAVGLGLISKYNFAGFLAVIVIPALLDPTLRRIILAPAMALTVGIAVIICLPHFLWVQGNQELFLQYVTFKLGQTEGSHFGRAVEGVGNALVAIVSFYLPFLIIAFFVFRDAFRRKILLMKPTDHIVRLLAGSNLVALILILAGVIVFGISNVTERYVIPFFLPGFLWVIWLLKNSRTPFSMANWTRVLVGGVCLIFLVRFIGVYYPGEPVCDDCQRWRPYYALKDRIEQANIDESAIFIGYEENTAGNLRRLLPDADVRSVNLLFYQPIERNTNKDCYLVWSEELVGQPIQDRFKHITESVDTLIITGSWRHLLRGDGWRKTEWGISPILPDSPFYKSFCRPR